MRQSNQAMTRKYSLWRLGLAQWPIVDNLVFIGVFGYLLFGLASGFFQYLWATAVGNGFITDLTGPVAEKQYYKIVLAVVGLLIPVLTLWEICLFFAGTARIERGKEWDRGKLARILRRVALEYKPTFLAALLGSLLTRVIVIDTFWRWQPAFQKLSFFTVGLRWYDWIYAWLAWELSTWVWHYGAHKIRLFWCLHSPHHAPQQFNMTVAWVHFFAEGYVTAVIQLTILMVLGVPPVMLLVIMAFEPVWGTFIHAGERSFATGRLGLLRYLVITPSYHRVHHGKNPLYMDTNFCTMLPVWDWLFGTLQPLRDEVKLQYGITRKLDATHFVDFYFGELLLLLRDVRDASGWRNKLLYLVKPPGWTPAGAEHTAATVRAVFLKDHPGLALPSKRRLLAQLFPAMWPAAPRPAPRR